MLVLGDYMKLAISWRNYDTFYRGGFKSGMEEFSGGEMCKFFVVGWDSSPISMVSLKGFRKEGRGETNLMGATKQR